MLPNDTKPVQVSREDYKSTIFKLRGVNAVLCERLKAEKMKMMLLQQECDAAAILRFEAASLRAKVMRLLQERMLPQVPSFFGVIQHGLTSHGYLDPFLQFMCPRLSRMWRMLSNLQQLHQLQCLCGVHQLAVYLSHLLTIITRRKVDVSMV